MSKIPRKHLRQPLEPSSLIFSRTAHARQNTGGVCSALQNKIGNSETGRFNVIELTHDLVQPFRWARWRAAPDMIPAVNIFARARRQLSATL